jgi:hypothetical protein
MHLEELGLLLDKLLEWWHADEYLLCTSTRIRHVLPLLSELMQLKCFGPIDLMTCTREVSAMQESDCRRTHLVKEVKVVPV